MKLPFLAFFGINQAFESPMRILCINDIHLDPMYKSNKFDWLQTPGEHSEFGGPSLRAAWISLI
jgi:hypothetical protein